MVTSEYKICFHCAPVFAGLKAANTITMPKEDLILLADMLKGSVLSYYPLAYKGDKAVVFVYRPSRLENCLQIPQRAQLLQKWGYPQRSLEKKLYHLRQRFLACQKKETGFPHELGVFLDYPLCDVMGFIKNHGNHYIFLGYWKVYGQAEETAQQFARFDNARKGLLQLLQRGVAIKDLYINKPIPLGKEEIYL